MAITCKGKSMPNLQIIHSASPLLPGILASQNRLRLLIWQLPWLPQELSNSRPLRPCSPFPVPSAAYRSVQVSFYNEAYWLAGMLWACVYDWVSIDSSVLLPRASLPANQHQNREALAWNGKGCTHGVKMTPNLGSGSPARVRWPFFPQVLVAYWASDQGWPDCTSNLSHDRRANTEWCPCILCDIAKDYGIRLLGHPTLWLGEIMYVGLALLTDWSLPDSFDLG